MENSKFRKFVKTNNRLWTATGRAVYVTVTLLVSGFSSAGEWEIDPIRIDLSQEQQTAAVTLKNASDQPTSVQIQVVAWSQDEGKDVYTVSRDLLVSPPIVTIPAKGEQVIRAALRRPADMSSELSYRINLQELPRPPLPGFMGVQVAMRVGLPVFVQPKNGLAAPAMAWKIVRQSDSQITVILHNSGNGHVQVTDFSIYAPDSDKALAGESGTTYVLAGQTHEWLLKAESLKKLADGRVHLIAYTDADTVDTELVLGKP